MHTFHYTWSISQYTTFLSPAHVCIWPRTPETTPHSHPSYRTIRAASHHTQPLSLSHHPVAYTWFQTCPWGAWTCIFRQSSSTHSSWLASGSRRRYSELRVQGGGEWGSAGRLGSSRVSGWVTGIAKSRGPTSSAIEGREKSLNTGCSF